MAQGACTQRSGTRTYLGISVAGRNSTCLLDTGCDPSMLPRRFVPTTPLGPTKVRVFAANSTKIPVTINVAVADIPVSCRFLVSDAVEEPMLGIDWLERNNCVWDFTRRSLIISGREVPLVRQENWEPDVCMEPNCAAVITRRQAREHARRS